MSTTKKEVAFTEAGEKLVIDAVEKRVQELRRQLGEAELQLKLLKNEPLTR